MHGFPDLGPTRAEDIVGGFVPTRRFAGVSFESYQPDPAFPSQKRAVGRLRRFVEALRPSSRMPRFWKRQTHPRAIYLDGGYGVGKTHLLAATYHATRGQRRYLSFAELAYTITRLGMPATLGAFQDARLVLIDEFELDDVAQTRMATMFLRDLMQRRRSVHVMATSNTLPSDLGKGRFAAEAFQREIGELAALFEVVSIDGEDYRHRHWDELDRPLLAAPNPGFAGAEIKWSELRDQLGQVHPVHYGRLAGQLEGLFIRDIERIEDQAVALRLVHFVDKLYDQQVALAISSRDGLGLTDIFSASYRQGGYEKKYRRCLSRLQELVAETATRSARPSSAPAAPPAADPAERPRDPARAD